MKPVTIEGCACVIGHMHGPQSPWIVREPTTGLLVSSARPTRKQAIADAIEKIQSIGGAERFRQAIDAHTTTP